MTISTAPIPVSTETEAPAAPPKRNRLWAWVIFIVAAAYFVIPLAATFYWSLRAEADKLGFEAYRRLFEDDVEGSRAWSEALLRAGVLSADEQQALDRALTDLLDAAAADPGFVSGPDEDVHAFVERQLVARVGATGKRLHTGRSRNEQVALDLVHRGQHQRIDAGLSRLGRGHRRHALDFQNHLVARIRILRLPLCRAGERNQRKQEIQRKL